MHPYHSEEETDLQSKSVDIFYFSTKTYVTGTQQKYLITHF